MPLIALVLLLSGGAHADAVSEPADCPDGSSPLAHHCGEWCVAWTCDTDENCSDATECVEAGQCIEHVSGECTTYYGPESYAADLLHGPCETDDDCSVGTCVVATYCLSPDYDADGDKAGGCLGCGSAPLHGSRAALASSAAIVGLGILLLVAVRRDDR